MEKAERKFLEGSIYLPYRWSLGPVITRFFEELKKRKIMGTKCPKCKRVLVPARGFCPRCFEETSEWVQVGSEGTLRNWTYVTYEFTAQPKKPPYFQGTIDLDGADTGLYHYIGGVDSDFEKAKKQLQIGMRVRAKWRNEPQGNILDIEYFEPV